MFYPDQPYMQDGEFQDDTPQVYLSVINSPGNEDSFHFARMGPITRIYIDPEPSRAPRVKQTTHLLIDMADTLARNFSRDKDIALFFSKVHMATLTVRDPRNEEALVSEPGAPALERLVGVSERWLGVMKSFEKSQATIDMMRQLSTEFADAVTDLKGNMPAQPPGGGNEPWLSMHTDHHVGIGQHTQQPPERGEAQATAGSPDVSTGQPEPQEPPVSPADSKTDEQGQAGTKD